MGATTTASEAATSTSSLHPTNPNSRTRVVHNSNRSFRTSLLQSGIKPFGSRLFKFPKVPYPPGSPELQAPEAVFDNCNVRQRQIGKVAIRLYEINSRSSISTRENFIPAQIHDLKTERESLHNASSYATTAELTQVQTHEQENVVSRDFATRSSTGPARKRKHIYYFAGGGFQNVASEDHWKLCAHLCHTMTSRGHPTTVSLVSYPLAPSSPASVTLPMLELFYYEILPSTPPSSYVGPPQTNGNGNAHEPHLALTRTKTRYFVPDEEIIFAGDSAGGNIALSLVLNVLAQNPRARVPSRIFLMSPVVDMRNVNPAMAATDKNDPLLSKRFVEDVARKYCGDNTDPADARVSPLLRDVTVLARRGITVDGVIAGYDVLGPDARLFREKCQAQGVTGEWLEWDKMIHCFPLAFSYKFLPESNEAIEWIIGRLMADA